MGIFHRIFGIRATDRASAGTAWHSCAAEAAREADFDRRQEIWTELVEAQGEPVRGE